MRAEDKNILIQLLEDAVFILLVKFPKGESGISPNPSPKFVNQLSSFSAPGKE